jgi:O-antigen ligase
MMPIGNIISKGIGLVFLFYFVVIHVLWFKNKIYVSNVIPFILIWFFFCIASGLFALNIGLVAVKIITIVQLILLFIAGYSTLIYGKITEKHIFYTFIISTVIVILYGFLTYEPTSAFVYKNRIASTTGNPNNLAVFGSFAYMFCLYLISIEKNAYKKLLLIILIPILVYGIIYTHSRQGVVLLIGSTIVYGILRSFYNYKISLDKRKYLVKGFIYLSTIILLLFIGYYYVKESSYFFRIYTLLSFLKIGINQSSINLAKLIDYSAYERSQFILYGIKIWADNLLFGVGLDNFREIIRHYWPISNPLYSHNNYIELLSTIGTIGTMAYYAIYYLVFYRLYKLLVNKKTTTQMISLIHLFITSLVSLMILELVTVSYYRKYTWILLIIVIGFSDRFVISKKHQNYKLT